MPGWPSSVLSRQWVEGGLTRAVAVTAREDGSKSAVAVIAAELLELYYALDYLTTRVNVNSENIGPIAGG